MSLTRKALDAMGLSEEQKDSIIEMHMETVNSLKAERDKLKGEAEQLPDVQEKLGKLTKELETMKKDDYKAKYESEKAAHDKLKEDITNKETKTKKADAFKSYLKNAGYSEKGIEKITKYGGFVDTIELDDNGTITNVDTLSKSIESEWGEYKPQAGTQRHTPITPPVAGKVTRTKEDIMKISDTAERQRAIAENIDLFK